jgi:hypothetical protein
MAQTEARQEAPTVVQDATAVHDVHGVRHEHERRVGAARLFPEAAAATSLSRCLLRNGTTGLNADFGNSFSGSFTIAIGTGFECVNVQLAGWHLDFTSSDHHINTIQVRISNVSYNVNTGGVSFTVSGFYRDVNGDDDFEWEVFFTILALG